MALLYYLLACFQSATSKFVHTNIFGSSFQLGYYYVDLWVGTPPVKQTVIIDTGSRLTAFPCMDCPECGVHMDKYFNYKNSSTSHVLTCADNTQCERCKTTDDLCRYSVSYVEGSSISGYLIRDSVVFGDELNNTHSVTLTFGCHKRETNLFKTQLVDGIMGLGTKGQAKNIVEALFSSKEISHNLFTICFGNENGYMTIGGYNESRHGQEIKWAPMLTSPFYAITATGLRVNGVNTGLLKSDFGTTYTTGTIVDSGTTFVYLTLTVYKMLYKKFDEYCNLEGRCLGEKLKVVGEPHVCYKFNKDSFTPEEFFSSFPELAIIIGDIEVVWMPERYLFAWWDTPNTFCVGVYNNGRSGNVLGGIFMRGNDVIFDLTAKQIGFVPSECGLNWTESFQNRARMVSEEYEATKINFIKKNGAFCLFIGLLYSIYCYLEKRPRASLVKSKKETEESISITLSE